MVSRLTESATYRHGWTTPEADAILSESARVAAWMRILAVLAQEQAAMGFIPEESARDIARIDPGDLDLEAVAAGTRETSHSTLGFIHVLQEALPEASREHVYYGITVQDLTDTWFAMVMRDIASLVLADLRASQAACVHLALRHRDTVMPGRTHGQTGSPITFGLKAATWADEISRQCRRVEEGLGRWSVGQLAGATGAMGFFDGRGRELRARVCARLGLADPGVSWTSSRDRISEFGTTMASVCATLARIGNEVYELQRTEIGELREARSPGTVGSITMPHKRNPERSEHLDTLARVARASAGVLLEAQVGSHERDGRAWKSEWFALPEIALVSAAAARQAAALLAGLEVDEEAMENHVRAHDTWASQQILVGLSAHLGKHRAQALLQDVLERGLAGEAFIDEVASAAGVERDAVREWRVAPDVREAVAMVDDVTSRLGEGPT